MDPLPVYLAVLAAAGDKNSRLRDIAEASDPTVISPPVIEEFTTEKLGTGLKVLRHFPVDPDPAPGQEPEIAAGLSYAWRDEQHETDLRVFTATADLARLQTAMPDIDTLTRGITIVPSHTNPVGLVEAHRKTRR